MGFLDWYERDRKLTDYTATELRREEERLRIRENQALSRLEKLEEEREAIFRRGALACTPVRRRILARLFAGRQGECERIEEELSRLTKESLAVAAIRYRLERRQEGDSNALKKVSGNDVDGLAANWENLGVSEVDFASEVKNVLGKVSRSRGDPLKGISRRAREIMEIWERYDSGELTGVDEGLSAMRESARSRAAEEE
jgi:hypothetical protein